MMSDIEDYNEHLQNLIMKIKQIKYCINQINRKKQQPEILQTLSRDLNRCIADYNNKQIRMMKNVQVSLKKIVFLEDKEQIYRENFLKFEKNKYVLKYILTKNRKQYMVNLNIYKLVEYEKVYNEAFKLLEKNYLFRLSESLLNLETFREEPNVKFLETQATQYLEEINKIFSGQLCRKCELFMGFDPESGLLLPPTISMIVQKRPPRHQQRLQKTPQQRIKQRAQRRFKQTKEVYERAFYHENCI